MKLLKIDSDENRLEVVPEILDDLWHLENTIEKNDVVSGATDRKIKIPGTDKTDRVKFFLVLRVDRVEFHRTTGQLRVNGTIIEGKPAELLEPNAFHALEIELGQKVVIQKAVWKEHQIQRLKAAQKATHQDAVLICILDDESASFGWLKPFSVEPVLTLSNPKTGKRFATTEDATQKYLSTIIQKAGELKPKKIVFAGPGFTKDDIKKKLAETKTKIAEQVLFETVNNTGETGFNELFKSGLLEKQVQQNQLIQDAQLFERFLTEIGRESGLAEYGFDAIRQAVAARAVSELLVLDFELAKNKTELFELIKTAEQNKARVHVLNHQTPSGKQLAGFGGIAAILKFKTNWG